MAGPTDCNLDFFYCLEWQLCTLLMQGSHFSYSKDSKKSKKGKKNKSIEQHGMNIFRNA